MAPHHKPPEVGRLVVHPCRFIGCKFTVRRPDDGKRICEYCSREEDDHPMTREEGLPKQDSLDEIADQILKLPTLAIVYGPNQLGPESISREDVLKIIRSYRR